MVHQDSIIAISSQDISEKITMHQVMTEAIVSHIRDWSIDKIDSATLVGDKIALYAEFEEWIEIEEEGDLEIISINEQLKLSVTFSYRYWTDLKTSGCIPQPLGDRIVENFRNQAFRRLTAQTPAVTRLLGNFLR